MKKLLSFVLVLSALSSTAFAEDAGAAMMLRINALNAAKAEMQVRASTSAAHIEAVQARIASTTARLEVRKEEIKDRIASTTAFLQERRAEIKSDIEIRIGKKLDGQKKEIAQRYENVIKTLNNLVTRVESRVAKMQAAGTDTTSIQASLDAAKVQITLTDSDITSLETLLATATSTASSTRKEMLSTIQTANMKAKTDAQTAYTSLIKVINSLTTERKEMKSTSTKPVKIEAHTEVHATATVQQ